MKYWVLAELMIQIISDIINHNKWFQTLLAENKVLLLIKAFFTQDSEHCEWWYHMTEIKNLENMIWLKQFCVLLWMLKSQTHSLLSANTHHHQLILLSTDITHW